MPLTGTQTPILTTPASVQRATTPTRPSPSMDVSYLEIRMAYTNSAVTLIQHLHNSAELMSCVATELALHTVPFLSLCPFFILFTLNVLVSPKSMRNALLIGVFLICR